MARSSWWRAAVAVVVLVVAAVALLRNAGEDSDDLVEAVPTTTTAPPWTDAPSTGSIVTAEGGGWPDGSAAPSRPGSARQPGDAHLWEDFDSATGSFLYWEYWFGTDAWVLSPDGDEVGEIRCPTPFCGRSAFGPEPDEVTVPPPDERCSGDTCVVGLTLPVRLQILGWDGAERDTMDISAAFDPDGDGTTERALIALSWSPDGSRLAVGTEGGEACDPYVIDRGRLVAKSPRPTVGDECRAEVWIFDRDGGEPQLVHTAVPADPTEGEPRQPPVLAELDWSPDGRSLAVSIARPPLGRPTWPELTVLRFEPGEPARAEVLHVFDDIVPAGAQLVYEFDYDRFAFAWSPDGTRIALAGQGGLLEISAADGGVLARHPGSSDVDLAWIADG